MADTEAGDTVRALPRPSASARHGCVGRFALGLAGTTWSAGLFDSVPPGDALPIKTRPHNVDDD